MQDPGNANQRAVAGGVERWQQVASEAGKDLDTPPWNKSTVREVAELLERGCLEAWRMRSGMLFSQEQTPAARRGAIRMLLRVLFLLCAKGRHLLGPERRSGLEELVRAALAPATASGSVRMHERINGLLTARDGAAPVGDDGEATNCLMGDEFLGLAINLLSSMKVDGEGGCQIDYANLSVRELGTIYEYLLSADRCGRKETGSFYTPEYIVQYMVQRTLGPVLERKLGTLRDAFTEVDRNGAGLGRCAELIDKLFGLKILDPAMGSGHFLVAALEYLAGRVTEFLAAFPSTQADRRQVRRMALERCIYGVDSDPQAVELARMSLWLCAGDATMPLNSLDHRLVMGDSLAGQALDGQVLPTPFDVVIANPPYLGVRTGRHPETLRRLAGKMYRSAVGNWDSCALFLERGRQVLADDGAMAMIVPTRLATNHDFAPIRALLFEHGGPQEVLDCGAAFDDPPVQASIIVHAPRHASRSPASDLRSPTPDPRFLSSVRDDEAVTLGFLIPHGLSNRRVISASVLRSLPDQPFTTTLAGKDLAMFQRIGAAPKRLGDLVTITRGMECGKNDRHVRSEPGEGLTPVISGEGVGEFQITEQGMFMELGLEPRGCYKDPALFLSTPKVLVRFVATQPVAAKDTRGYASFNTVYNLLPRQGGEATLDAVVGLLNSKLVRWWFGHAYNSEEAVFPHIQKYQLEAIPMPDLNEAEETKRELTAEARRLCEDPKRGRERLEILVAKAYGEVARPL